MIVGEHNLDSELNVNPYIRKTILLAQDRIYSRREKPQN